MDIGIDGPGDESVSRFPVQRDGKMDGPGAVAPIVEQARVLAAPPPMAVDWVPPRLVWASTVPAQEVTRGSLALKQENLVDLGWSTPELPRSLDGIDSLRYRSFTELANSAQDLFTSKGPRLEDVRQGMGPCGLAAALGAAAPWMTRVVRKVDGTLPEEAGFHHPLMQPGSSNFEVLFHESTPPPLSVGRTVPTGRLIRMFLTPDLPVDGTHPDCAAFAEVSRSTGAWPGIVEKALLALDRTWSDERRAASKGLGYGRLHTDAPAEAEALTQLTGRPAEVLCFEPSPKRGEAFVQWLLAQVEAGKPVIVGTRTTEKDEELPCSLYPHHSYVVLVENGRVRLHNPWGMAHPEPASGRELMEGLDGWVATLV
jgi:hypothetical protein